MRRHLEVLVRHVGLRGVLGAVHDPLLQGADILVSIHNNAFPDGVNPFENNGTSAYYFQPRSERLARLVADGIAATPCAYSPIGIRLAGKPALSKQPLVGMEPVTLKARDGLEIHGYLTLPLGERHEEKGQENGKTEEPGKIEGGNRPSGFRRGENPEGCQHRRRAADDRQRAAAEHRTGGAARAAALAHGRGGRGQGAGRRLGAPRRR